MTGVLINFSNSCKKLQSVFQWEWVDDNKQCKYEKRNWNPFSKVTRKRNTKNEIQIRFSKWWENEKQKPKFKSPFQSAAKTKNEKENSNPFFNVTSRQKTKNRNGDGIPFYKAEEKRKIKMKFKFLFFYAIEKRLALRYTHSHGPFLLDLGLFKISETGISSNQTDFLEMEGRFCRSIHIRSVRCSCASSGVFHYRFWHFWSSNCLTIRGYKSWVSVWVKVVGVGNDN